MQLRRNGSNPLVYEPTILPENHAANPTTYDPCGNNPFEPTPVFNDLAPEEQATSVALQLLGVRLWLKRRKYKCDFPSKE